MSGMTKARRLAEMKRLYIQRAYTDIEMAKRLGVTRETIFRDRRELTSEYPIEKDDQGRYQIPRTKLISEIKLNLHEALTLYLAGRRTSRQTRFHQSHTINAVEKLAATLRQPMTDRLLKSAGGGAPEGLFLNNAVQIVDGIVPPPSPGEVKTRILLGLRRMAEDGYVTVHDAGVDAAYLAALEDLERDGGLPIRFYTVLSLRDENLIAAGPRKDRTRTITVFS